MPAPPPVMRALPALPAGGGGGGAVRAFSRLSPHPQTEKHAKAATDQLLSDSSATGIHRTAALPGSCTPRGESITEQHDSAAGCW